jgi:hypothetical protein
MPVSTPEVTAVDLVRLARSAGQLDNVATVLAELVPLLDPMRLVKAVRATGDVPNAQHLGYPLERGGRRPLTQLLHDWLGRQSVRVIPPRSGRSAAGAAEDRRWYVLVTEPVEIET